MKLDFFDRLFGRERKEGSLELIDSDKLRDWLEGQITSRKREIYKGCISLIDDIFLDLEGIKTATLELEELECPDEIPKKARKIVVTSKPAFVHGILDSIAVVENKKPSGYDELKKFHEDLQAVVSSLGRITISHGRYLSIAFEDEIDNIRIKSKKLFEMSRELEGRIGSDVSPLSEALEKLDEIEVKLRELKDLDTDRSNLKEKLKRYSEERSDLEKEIDSLHETLEFKELTRTEEELREVREKLESVELDIYNYINPLKRSMKRFRRFAEVKGYEPEILKNIDRYMQDPVDCFLLDKDGDLEDILMKIRKAIEAGDFKLKSKDREKVLTRIESALNIDKNKLRERHLKLNSRREDLLKRINSFSVNEKRKELKRDLDHLEREVKTSGDELDRIEDKSKDIERDISRRREELERKLNDIEGYRIKINWRD